MNKISPFKRKLCHQQLLKPTDVVLRLKASSNQPQSQKQRTWIAYLMPKCSATTARPLIASSSNSNPTTDSPFPSTSATPRPLEDLLRPYEKIPYFALGVRSKTPLAGHGASATVFRLEWRGRRVAAKSYRDSTTGCKFEAYFENELRIMAEVGKHPNLVEFIGYSECPNAIIMEFCLYGSLFDLLHQNHGFGTRFSSTTSSTTTTPNINTFSTSPTTERLNSNSSSSSLLLLLSPQTQQQQQLNIQQNDILKAIQRHRARIAIGIARGMAHLHKHRYAHLDLTSCNILLGADFEAKVCDYGLATPFSADEDGTFDHKLGHATSFWKAPEIVHRKAGESRHVYSAKVDVFSFSMIVWELFHPGRFPFDDLKNELTPPETLVQQGQRPTISADCPQEWRTLMIACWQQLPENRPHSRDIVNWMESNLDVLLQADCDNSP